MVTFCILLLSLIQFESDSTSTSTSISAATSYYSVSSSVELALIIAGLSDLDLESNKTINRNTPYFNRIEEHFGEFRDHEIFDSLGVQYNLPRLAGNAADYTFDEKGELYVHDDSGSLWKDEKGNLFRRYVSSIQDFAEQSDYLSFYQSEQTYYEELVSAYEQVSDQDNAIEWLNRLFEPKEADVRIFISPLISGLHWTTLYKKEQRIFVHTVNPETISSLDPITKMDITRVLFTELDHAYVNPVTASQKNMLVNSSVNLEDWGNSHAIRAYNSEELIFNEYMTWGVFLLYAEENLTQEDYDEYAERITKFMENRRGFIRFSTFMNKLNILQGENNLTGEEMVKRMIVWFASYSE